VSEDEHNGPGLSPDLPDYRRPDGVTGSFAPRPEPPTYAPPPPTVPPAEQETFGRPAGAGAFAPAPGTRMPPRPAERQVIPPVIAEAFGGTGRADQHGFDPAPGTRIEPRPAPPESPWWKPGALHDPWRNPQSPYWLGRGAIFVDSRPEQLPAEQDEEEGLADGEEETLPSAEPTRRRRFGLSVLGLALVLGLVAGAIGGLVGYFVADRTQQVLHRSNVSLAQVNTAANRPPGSVADIAKRVGPAVVSIAVKTPSEYGVGSGVVIDKDGDVLTNNHVVAGAAGVAGATITVTFSNEDTTRARIVGRDPISDLAVLHVPGDRLTVATLGNSAKLAVGDPVIAIGSPLGLEGTVTAGIVSALGRPVAVPDETGNSQVYLDAIQTDAAINPGNSGGALVDAQGAVVGINSAAALGTRSGSGTTTSTSGIGFAIPINYARDVAQQLIRTGQAQHGSLDAQGRTATAGLQQGAYLEQVLPHGAAAKAGLRNGDVIVAADGHAIISYDQLVVLVQQHHPGDAMSVTYYRGAAKRSATVTLGRA
jgi:S1-C subfamily serine protease